jgi:hypothetical protein
MRVGGEGDGWLSEEVIGSNVFLFLANFHIVVTQKNIHCKLNKGCVTLWPCHLHLKVS